MSIAETILALRDEMGWTQKQLADSAGVNLSSVKRAENGKPVYSTTLEKIAEVGATFTIGEGK